MPQAADTKTVPTASRARPRASTAAVTPTLPRIEAARGASLVNLTVDALRKAVLAAAGPGVFLGSEEQLIEALGVSRPTFRQATKLLLHENLLVIKRGMGGGFFTQTPSGEAVSRMAAIYLNAQGTTLLQIHDALVPLMAEAAVLVSRNSDAAVRSRLYDELLQLQSAACPDGRSAIRDLLQFVRLLGEQCGNAAVALMMTVLRDLLRDAGHGDVAISPERAKVLGDFQRALAEAVRDGDTQRVFDVAIRYGSEIRSWIPAGSVPGL